MKKADRIYHIILILGGKASLDEIRNMLCISYNKPKSYLTNRSVASTIKSDNISKINNNKPPRFKTYQDGEERGFISLLK